MGLGLQQGGDFGKRELSPALRNRFTEIWVPPLTNPRDLQAVVDDTVAAALPSDLAEAVQAMRSELAKAVTEFTVWYNGSGASMPGPSPAASQKNPGPEGLAQAAEAKEASSVASSLSEVDSTDPTAPSTLVGQRLTLRDIHSWIEFVSSTMQPLLSTTDSDSASVFWRVVVHGAGLVLLDGLGLGSGSGSAATRIDVQRRCYDFLLRYLPSTLHESVASLIAPASNLSHTDSSFGIAPFYIPYGPHKAHNLASAYALTAPTTSQNLVSTQLPAASPCLLTGVCPRCRQLRVLRALQLRRPILLEGSPGAGKTSLISALAKATGHRLVGICSPC